MIPELSVEELRATIEHLEKCYIGLSLEYVNAAECVRCNVKKPCGAIVDMDCAKNVRKYVEEKLK